MTDRDYKGGDLVRPRYPSSMLLFSGQDLSKIEHYDSNKNRYNSNVNRYDLAKIKVWVSVLIRDPW